MASIICDNAAVESLLRELVDQILDLGGRISADAEIVCRNGNLSVECSADASPETELIFLPEAALIPMSPVTLSARGDELSIQNIKGEMDAGRRSLLDLMVRLFNLTGKIRDFREASPRLSLLDYPHILEHLLAGRPKPKNQPTPGTPEFDILIANLFVKSRTLGYKFAGETRKSYALMPIVDSFNHHSFGAGFGLVTEGRTRGLAVRVSRPIAGSMECFANYGFYDALDCYLQYAYMDRNAPFLRSAPCDLKITGIGRITVKSQAGAKYDGPLAKEIRGLRIFMPRVMPLAPRHFQLSHLIIPWPERRFALRRTLVEIFKMVDPSRPNDFLVTSVALAERDLLTQNLAYYRKLEQMIHSGLPDGTADALRNLVAIQRERIQTYIDAINHPADA